MLIAPVDERDSGWEDDTPRFRVYVFDPLRALNEPGEVRRHEDGARDRLPAVPPRPPYLTSTWDVTDADALDVLRWAQAKAGADGLYSVALVRTEPDGSAHGGLARGLVWLVGMDYQDTPQSDVEIAVQGAMRRRRGRVLVLPG